MAWFNWLLRCLDFVVQNARNTSASESDYSASKSTLHFKAIQEASGGPRQVYILQGCILLGIALYLPNKLGLVNVGILKYTW